MSSIQLLIDGSCGPRGALVPVDIFSVQAKASSTAIAPIGIATTLTAPSGPLLVQATLADGRLLTASVELSTGETITLHLSTTSRPAVSPPKSSSWARLWRQTNPRMRPVQPGGSMAMEWAWGLAAFSPQDVHVSLSSLCWRLSLRPRNLHVLEIGGENIPQRSITLPPADEVTVTLSLEPASAYGLGGGYALSVRTQHEPIEALLAYYASGNLALARRFVDACPEQLEEMLVGDRPDPFGAVVLGYFFIRTRATNRLSTWPEKLARHFPWLPDATIIGIGTQMLSPDPDTAKLRALVTRAVRAGLPVYTDGLQLLYRAVELLLIENANDNLLSTTYEQVRKYARAADWDAVLTSFRGSPNSPTVRSRTGAPSIGRFVVSGKTDSLGEAWIFSSPHRGDAVYSAPVSAAAVSIAVSDDTDISMQRQIHSPLGAVGRRKAAVVRARLFPGTGEFTLNRRPIESYFPSKHHQNIVREPLVIVGKVGTVDVLANLHGGGIKGQADALRLAIARALCDEDPDLRPALKKAGLLTRDARVKESKKPGRKKARKAPQYSKR